MDSLLKDFPSPYPPLLGRDFLSAHSIWICRLCQLLPSKLHFSTVIHYFSTFVQQHPGYLYAHLLFIVLVGVLWPLQVGKLSVDHCIAEFAGQRR